MLLKHGLFIYFIVLFCQNISAQNLSTPRQSVIHHLINLQDEQYYPSESALALKGGDLSAQQKSKLAIQLKQIFDLNGDYIEVDDIPNDSNYLDSATQTKIYFPTKNKEIYLKKYGNQWLYSSETAAKIPKLYAGLFPYGSSAVMNFLPQHLKGKFLNLATWQWIGLLVILILGIALFYSLKFIFNELLIRLSQRIGQQRFARKVISTIGRPLSFIFVIYLIKYLSRTLLFKPIVYKYLFIILDVLIPILVVVITYRIIEVFGIYLQKRAEKTKGKMDDQLIPLLKKVGKTIVVILGGIFVLQQLGVNVTGLIAGLSIGGLALALAAQDTLKNLLGSIMIFFDKPFQIGDWISGPDIDGEVEEVGLRATRVRTFRNSLQYIPNSKVSDMVTDNHGLRNYRRFSTTIAITYNTPPQKIDDFVKNLRQLVLEHPSTVKDKFHVYLNAFNNSSLDILFYIFFDVPTWGDELKARHETILQILKLAEGMGVEMAFPTRTVHLVKED